MRCSTVLAASSIAALVLAAGPVLGGDVPGVVAIRPGPIAFCSFRGGDWDLCVLDARRGNERRLTTDPANGVPRAPSPNSADTAAWSRTGGGVASIEYTLPKAGHVHVRVYDAAGRMVAHPVHEWQSAGRHVTMFAFGPAPNQVFHYRVECGRRRSTGKIDTGP